MTAIAIQSRATALPYPYSTGTSDASKSLQRFLVATSANLRKAVTWDHLNQLLAALEEIYQECAEPDWDGYGARPIAQETFDEAVRFLSALPSWLPAPEIVPEPDGDIGFEWNYGTDRVLVASVDGTNVITYAGILGIGNKAHGTEVFDGAIPQTLINHISRICPRKDIVGQSVA